MIDEHLRSDESIARGLPRTWPHFFAPFGRLTATQRAVIPTILAGQDVLLCAATASGKTEAACAPLIERYLGQRHPWTILYISPTRALVNDLYERLYAPVNRLGLRIDRRTGEYRPTKHIQPNILLTTPESFDSMLCREKSSNPPGHLLSGVTALVLDEIHLLHGTPRGEQVRWLTERLRRLRNQAKRSGWIPSDHLHIVALSATVPRPHEVVRTFLANGIVVETTGGRAIDIVTSATATGQVESALPSYLAKLPQPEKVLVFSNSRKRVDELAAVLRPILATIGYETRAHHGSLHRNEREGTEDDIKRERAVVVFATSTLEIGVDIGDIDLVVLDGPAPDIPSLLQRIGRGNRRSGMTRVMACSSGPVEHLIHSAMIEAAQDGWLGSGEHGPNHAVARQQIASYIFQAPKRARPRRQLQEFVETCGAPVVAKSLLPAMLGYGEVIADGGGVRLGDTWLELTSRADIHSNIESSLGSTVMDESTGQSIAIGIQAHTGRGLKTGGHLLEVRKWSEFKIEVRRVGDETLAIGDWRYASKARHVGASQPEAVRRYLDLPTDEWPIVLDDTGSFVFHFGGSCRAAIIELAAATQGIELPSGALNPWYLRLSTASEKPSWLKAAGPASLEMAIESRIDRLERLLARPGANKQLPIDIRVDEVRGWLRLDAELRTIRHARWVAAADVDLQRVLRALAAGLRRR